MKRLIIITNLIKTLFRNMPPKKVYRAYGLQCPLNAWQILVICFHVINAVIFYFGISLKFNVVYFSIYTFFCTIAVGAWFYTSSVDAALAPSKCEEMLCLPLHSPISAMLFIKDGQRRWSPFCRDWMIF